MKVILLSEDRGIDEADTLLGVYINMDAARKAHPGIVWHLADDDGDYWEGSEDDRDYTALEFEVEGMATGGVADRDTCKVGDEPQGQTLFGYPVTEWENPPDVGEITFGGFDEYVKPIDIYGVTVVLPDGTTAEYKAEKQPNGSYRLAPDAPD